jgi:hypothetical protein
MVALTRLNAAKLQELGGVERLLCGEDVRAGAVGLLD